MGKVWVGRSVGGGLGAIGEDEEDFVWREMYLCIEIEAVTGAREILAGKMHVRLDLERFMMGVSWCGLLAPCTAETLALSTRAEEANSQDSDVLDLIPLAFVLGLLGLEKR